MDVFIFIGVVLMIVLLCLLNANIVVLNNNITKIAIEIIKHIDKEQK